MFATLKKVTFFNLVVFVLLNINYTYAAYITNQSDTSKACSSIDTEFSNGNITKIECVTTKSTDLQFNTIS